MADPEKKSLAFAARSTKRSTKQIVEKKRGDKVDYLGLLRSRAEGLRDVTMPVTEYQESSTSFSSIGRSFLGTRRDQVHAMDTGQQQNTGLDQELDAFQRRVAALFHDLAASAQISTRSLPTESPAPPPLSLFPLSDLCLLLSRKPAGFQSLVKFT